MENQEELETVDISYWLDMLNSLERLQNNPDFKKVITNGYMKNKALDSVSMLADPGVKQRDERTDIMEDLVSISNLQYYLFMIKQLGEGAKVDMEEVEE